MLARNAFFLLLTFASGGCRVLASCNYELRDLEAAITVSIGDAIPDTAKIRLEENRGSINGTSMTWVVTAPTLKGHVLSAVFKDAADLSTVRLDLGVAPAAHPEITQGTADTRSGANLGGVHDMLAAGRGVIELQTDDPSNPTFTFHLAAQSVGDWFRPNCY